jgi:hypothetical protein
LRFWATLALAVEKAAEEAVNAASKTVKNIRSVWIKDHSAVVKDGEITKFRVTCKLTFEVED